MEFWTDKGFQSRQLFVTRLTERSSHLQQLDFVREDKKTVDTLWFYAVGDLTKGDILKRLWEGYKRP